MWGSTYQSILNRVILQKKIISNFFFFDSHTQAHVLFKEQEILIFSYIYLYQIGKFMYLLKRVYFLIIFVICSRTLTSQLHSHYIRNCNLFYIPPCRTNIRNFSIRFQGPKFFNSLLSPENQNSESICLFGKRLKKFVLSKTNNYLC